MELSENEEEGDQLSDESPGFCLLNPYRQLPFWTISDKYYSFSRDDPKGSAGTPNREALNQPAVMAEESEEMEYSGPQDDSIFCTCGNCPVLESKSEQVCCQSERQWKRSFDPTGNQYKLQFQHNIS